MIQLPAFTVNKGNGYTINKFMTTKFPLCAIIMEMVRYGFIKIRMKVVNFIKKIFIKNHFHQKPLSSKTTFIKNHFHQNHFDQNHFDQNPLSSRTTFIKNHFHQKPLSSKTTFIKNHFHQKPFSSKTTFIKNHFHQKTPNPKDQNPTDPKTLKP